MPNLTFYISAGHMPSDERLAELSRDCVELCTRVLEASLDNVHVIYVEARHGHGHPVFAEVQYRLDTHRTAPVMNRFIDALGDAIGCRTGLTARIRCFGHAASNIHARN
ncbi:hypothetical protein [Paraburkholderia sp.]|uniref:hypothetical protein n=1 Tax=Paraburkholderia sp. TaxID=1926495 RepID=UPI0023A5ABF9|nr:hypothetical protein [Paraburkholderia sp.]MDE1180394.1 hypothetical protein [Paraburkholderia sp.]